jgi:small glutamine-rich tetratricopeptide repeat-containing protein alpha
VSLWNRPRCSQTNGCWPKATESKKRLALAIIDFLSTCANDGTFPADEKDSIEVAQTCIAESFGVDPTDKAALEDAIGGQSLLSIYSVYERLKGRGQKQPPRTPSSPAAAAASPAGPTAAQKQEADALKGQGNAAMAKKDYDAAISFYTKALELVPQNPIYLSNRAAAYSASQKHEHAMTDAQAAVEADPKYTKAWSRLGLAKFALGDAKGSMEAYQKGIEYEGNGGSEAMRRGYETAKKRVEEDAEDDVGGSPRSGGNAPGGGFSGMPDLSGLASMLGGGAGGGAPDLGSLMNNPMFSSAAQSLMSNPELMNNLMSNPRLREMAESFGGAGGRGGGGMPDFASLMSDPSIAEM